MYMTQAHEGFMLLLFLHRSRHLPDLHSFPTRRSSDLRGRAAREPRVKDASTPPGELTSAALPVCGSGTLQQSRSDRKSTRLNSSHMSISYAVFCLKKKNLLHVQNFTTHRLQLHNDYLL